MNVSIAQQALNAPARVLNGLMRTGAVELMSVPNITCIPHVPGVEPKAAKNLRKKQKRRQATSCCFGKRAEAKNSGYWRAGTPPDGQHPPPLRLTPDSTQSVAPVLAPKWCPMILECNPDRLRTGKACRFQGFQRRFLSLWQWRSRWDHSAESPHTWVICGNSGISKPGEFSICFAENRQDCLKRLIGC